MTKLVDSQQRVPVPWKWVTAALAVLQLLTPALISRLYGDFLATAATNEAAITPAGYAFGIWGLITVLCVISCLALLRQDLGVPWQRRILIDASMVFVGFIGWLVIAAQNWLWITVAVLAWMVMALTDLFTQLVARGQEIRAPQWLRWLLAVTFGLYLGWTSIAVFANIAAALVYSGLSPTDARWQLVVLLTAAAAAVYLTARLRGTPGYVAGAVWALAAVSIGAAGRHYPVLSIVAAVAVLLVAATAATSLIVHRRRADPHQ